jgi:uncharacterized protein (DUF2141 family)
MRIIKLLFITISLCALSLSGLAQAEQTSQLEVHVYGAKNDIGQVLITVYNSGENWLKHDADKIVAQRSIPADQHVQTVFDNLPYGKYAIAVIHDENNNKKIDMSWLPVPHPEEGYGFSNDAQPNMGPPKFEDAVFTIKKPKVSKKILLHY